MEIKVQRLSLWMINTVFLLPPINNHPVSYTTLTLPT
ncbi:protein YmgL, partial [Escherichia coli]